MGRERDTNSLKQTTPGIEDKPNTWCKKVPRKICAPDNCRMVSGPQECSEKNIVSTVQKPTELCDLQPQQHCRLITKLTPHLISKEVCRKVPKEVCHLALSPPKTVRKPITLKWCTRKKHDHKHGGSAYKAPNSYLPPPGSVPPSPQFFLQSVIAHCHVLPTASNCQRPAVAHGQLLPTAR